MGSLSPGEWLAIGCSAVALVFYVWLGVILFRRK